MGFSCIKAVVCPTYSKALPSLFLSGPRPANRCTWSRPIDRTWRINGFLGPQPLTLVSSPVSCAHCFSSSFQHRHFLWVSLFPVTTQHDTYKQTYDVGSSSLLSYREQTPCHVIQHHWGVFFCVIVHSVEVTSITNWQMTEGRNITAEAFLFLLRVMIWPVSQREGSEIGEWAKKLCPLFIAACRHRESERPETDLYKEESTAEIALDDRICLNTGLSPITRDSIYDYNIILNCGVKRLL